MKNTSILLSISMLISGKEDMEKSLKSLMYFKEAFPSEIILVDTGCNAEQRGLAEQYADKIIDFEWCNDFAAARNAGLREAQGEWFLYLDDDEWFDNPQEIIAFFKTGEYKQYNCASYVVRNYSNFQGTMYDDSYPSRMVKREAETKFVGKIHEYIIPYKMPKKNFSDFVHHYGYVYKSEEDKKKHAYRNITPLLEMRKQHPGDPRWMCQLAQEYFSIEEYEKVVLACKEALAEWYTLKEFVPYAPSHLGALYAYILISLESLGTTDALQEEEEWLQKALQDPILKSKEVEPTIAFLYLAGARLYSRLKKHVQCRDYMRKYVDLYYKLKEERELIETGTAAIVAGVFQEQLLYGVILLSIESVIRTEDYVLAEEIFCLMDWSDRRLLRQMEHEKNILDASCSVGFHPAWVRILQTLVSREDGMKEMYIVFLEAEIEYEKNGDSEKLFRMRRIVSELNYEHRYIFGTKMIYEAQNPTQKSREEHLKAMKALYAKLFQQYTKDIFEMKAEVWNIAERMEIPMEPFILDIDDEEWRQIAEEWSMNASVEELQQWDVRIAKWKQQDDIRYGMFSVKCLEGYLYHYQELCPELGHLEQLLWQHADAVLKLHKKESRQFSDDEMKQELPEDLQLALGLKELQGYRESGDDLKALEALRKCLGLYQPLMRVLDAYAKQCRDEISIRNGGDETERAELMRLVLSLKNAARVQIEQGAYQTAKNILIQIQQCVPEDEEVVNMLKNIRE